MIFSLLRLLGSPVRRLPEPLVEVLRQAAYLRHDAYCLVTGADQKRHQKYVQAFYDRSE